MKVKHGQEIPVLIAKMHNCHHDAYTVVVYATATGYMLRGKYGYHSCGDHYTANDLKNIFGIDCIR